MKLQIARDKNGSLRLYVCKPIEIGGIFYAHDGYHRIDYDTSYVKGWYIDGIDRNLFPEVTFENSPQEVELTLRNHIDTVKIQDHNPKKQTCVLTNHGIVTDVVFK